MDQPGSSGTLTQVVEQPTVTQVRGSDRVLWFSNFSTTKYCPDQPSYLRSQIIRSRDVPLITRYHAETQLA